MSYQSTGDVNRYQILTGNKCYDIVDKKEVDPKICIANPSAWTPATPPPGPPAASITGNLPKWLLPVGIGVAVFLFFKMRSGPKQNPARRRRRRNPYTVVKKRKRLASRHVRTADWIDSTRSQREKDAADARRRAYMGKDW